MKKAIIPIIFVLINLVSYYACYYDNEEALYPQLLGSCDTTNVTYTATIAPIMSSNCTSCHGASASGGLDLRTYELVKANVNKVYGSMNHDVGFSAMPQGGSLLDDCTLLKVKVWKDNQTPQ